MSQDTRKILAENVRFYRTAKKLKREELSLLINCDNSYISKVEKMRMNITLDKLEVLAEVLGINVIDLLKIR